MPGGIKIEGKITQNQVEVSSNGELLITREPSYICSNLECQRMGTIYHGVDHNNRRKWEPSRDYRARVGTDEIIFDEIFPGATALNTSQWFQASTTMTLSMTSGAAVLNAGNSLASGAYFLLRSYKYFNIGNTFRTYFEMDILYSRSVSNNRVEYGFGIVATTAAPTDGAFFRDDSDGNFKCVVCYGGFEIQKVIPLPRENEKHRFQIKVGNQSVEFWIDDTCACSIEANFDALPNPISGMSVPVFVRNYNVGAVSTAIQVKVFSCNIAKRESQSTKEWAHTLSSCGFGSYTAQIGSTMGSTCNWTNSAAPTTTTPTTGTAAYATLGGNFAFNAVATTENDLILFAYQNPAGTASIPAGVLYITDIAIDTCVMGAIIDATTPTVHEWKVGVNSTTLALSTADSDTARGTRVIPLGMQNYAASSTIATKANRITHSWKTPLVIDPGCYIHIILKVPSGVATASQIFRGVAMIVGYWE